MSQTNRGATTIYVQTEMCDGYRLSWRQPAARNGTARPERYRRRSQLQSEASGVAITPGSTSKVSLPVWRSTTAVTAVPSSERNHRRLRASWRVGLAGALISMAHNRRAPNSTTRSISCRPPPVRRRWRPEARGRATSTRAPVGHTWDVAFHTNDSSARSRVSLWCTVAVLHWAWRREPRQGATTDGSDRRPSPRIRIPDRNRDRPRPPTLSEDVSSALRWQSEEPAPGEPGFWIETPSRPDLTFGRNLLDVSRPPRGRRSWWRWRIGRRRALTRPRRSRRRRYGPPRRRSVAHGWP